MPKMREPGTSHYIGSPKSFMGDKPCHKGPFCMGPFNFIEPTCVYARWAFMRHFLYVCLDVTNTDLTKSLMGFYTLLAITCYIEHLHAEFTHC